MKRIALYTKNRLLQRRISLIARGIGEVVTAKENTAADFVIVDRESYPDLNIDGYILPYEDNNGKIRNLPISHKELLLAISDAREFSEKLLTLSREDRQAHLGGSIIKLTELEARLLEELLLHDGYVTREKLLNAVWGEGTDRGIVNVYVHYLREKLESEGDKIILSSRREGYMIDKRFKRR